MQLNNCDGVLSIYWNTLLGQQISQHTAISMSKSALANIPLYTIISKFHFVKLFIHKKTHKLFEKRIKNDIWNCFSLLSNCYEIWDNKARTSYILLAFLIWHVKTKSRQNLKTALKNYLELRFYFYEKTL